MQRSNPINTNSNILALLLRLLVDDAKECSIIDLRFFLFFYRNKCRQQDLLQNLRIGGVFLFLHYYVFSIARYCCGYAGGLDVADTSSIAIYFFCAVMYGFLGHINTCENSSRLTDSRKTLCQEIRRKVIEMQINMILLGPNSASLTNCHASDDQELNSV